MIHIITGDGKGKTTAALGMAMRAAGHGLTVLIIRFCKGNNPDYYGEIGFFGDFIKVIKHSVSIMQYGLNRIVYAANMTEEDIQEAQRGWKFAKYQIRYNHYNMIILDEINICIDLKMINLREVKEVLLAKPKEMEVVLTGRNAHPDLIEIADLVSDIKQVKHYFDKGIKARKGVEY
jgi:cob(I)alamin adenosyltransferase